MKFILTVTLLWISTWNPSGEKDRTITYEGQEVSTTFDVSDSFLGTYKGNKSGYLQLNEDGTGLFLKICEVIIKIYPKTQLLSFFKKILFYKHLKNKFHCTL